jgi:hypothetical protein
MSNSSPPAGNDPSLSCDPAILEALKQATHKGHVRQLLQRHDANDVNQAWRCLDPIERSALLLCKNLDGTIVPGLQVSDL